MIESADEYNPLLLFSEEEIERALAKVSTPRTAAMIAAEINRLAADPLRRYAWRLEGLPLLGYASEECRLRVETLLAEIPEELIAPFEALWNEVIENRERNRSGGW